MVDTRDLKSLGPKGCAGSSPARGTKVGSLELTFCFLRDPEIGSSGNRLNAEYYVQV